MHTNLSNKAPISLCRRGVTGALYICPSTTLIDNIFCSNSDDLDSSVSGVISERISDHQCIFTYHPQASYFEKVSKYVEIERKDDVSIEHFISELNEIKLFDQLDHSLEGCPQKNYDIFSLLIKYVKNKHLPKKRENFKNLNILKASG